MSLRRKASDCRQSKDKPAQGLGLTGAFLWETNTFTNMWQKRSESDDASPPPRRCSSTVGRAPSRSSWTRPVSPSRRSSCCCVRRRPGRPPPASGSPPHRCWSTAGHRVQSEEVSREPQVGGHVEVTSCHFCFCFSEGGGGNSDRHSVQWT